MSLVFVPEITLTVAVKKRAKVHAKLFLSFSILLEVKGLLPIIRKSLLHKTLSGNVILRQSFHLLPKCSLDHLFLKNSFLEEHFKECLGNFLLIYYD